MSRGRPKQTEEKLTKWELETNTSTFYYDENKTPRGCYKVEQKFFPGEKFKVKIDKKPYGKLKVYVAFKTSNRSNAKTKIKRFNQSIDYILSTPKLPGISDKAIILDVGVGDSFKEKFENKYL